MVTLIGIVTVLVMLNMVRFIGQEPTASTSAQNYPQVASLPLATRFRVESPEQGGRNIFLAKGPDVPEESPVQEMEIDLQPVTDPEPEDELIDASDKADMEVLGIGRRANRSVAMIRYKGKTQFVAIGDRVGDDYIIRDINDLNVYLSRQ
ncbi:MAG: hypothetical protein MI794_16775 [Pseudomonadales bacterium]|nr:hypothetical protein [Pseudomonadales bacterium]